MEGYVDEPAAVGIPRGLTGFRQVTRQGEQVHAVGGSRKAQVPPETWAEARALLPTRSALSLGGRSLAGGLVRLWAAEIWLSGATSVPRRLPGPRQVASRSERD